MNELVVQTHAELQKQVTSAPALPPVQPFIERLQQGQMPSQADYINSLSSIHILAAIAMVICGVVYLLYGWKIFKVLVVVNTAIIGAAIGAHAAGMLKGPNMPIFGGLAGAVLLGALAWPLMKWAVSFMGALAGAFLGYWAWLTVVTATHVQGLEQYSWVGALLGLVTLGLLAFIIFRAVIITFTSFQGAMLVTSGALALGMTFQSIGPDLKNALMSNQHLLPILVLVPALIGAAFQHVGGGKKPAKPAEK